MTQAELARSPQAQAGNQAVFRLIYRSRSKIAAARLDTELGNILRVARANNSAKNITGALLVYDNWFAQALEGNEDAVRELYAHIARDSRHDTVEVREEGMAGMRVFSRWSMALVGEHGESDIPLAATSTGTTPAAARPATSDQDRVLAIMRDATRGYGRGS